MNLQGVAMKKIYGVSIVFLMCAMVGCSKYSYRSKKKIDQRYQKNSTQKIDLEIEVAKHQDLPEAPLGFVVKKIEYDSTNQQNLAIFYQAQHKQYSDPLVIKQLCCGNMDILGWNLIGEFYGDTNWMLVFRKPSDIICTISYTFSSGYLMFTRVQKNEDPV